MAGIGVYARLVALVLVFGTSPGNAASAQEQVTPSAANPGVRNLDGPDLVQLVGATVGTAPLAVFMPGTGGRSEKAPTTLLTTIGRQGYNVNYLTYDDTPAVSNVCPNKPAA